MIKTGVGVMIKKGNQVLLGHRCENYKDTGGIYQVDSWTFPGGKQEEYETVVECAIREVNEETSLEIIKPKMIGVQDDIDGDRRFFTILFEVTEYKGEEAVMEEDKINQWQWFDLDHLPHPLYEPTSKFIRFYKHKYFGRQL